MGIDAIRLLVGDDLNAVNDLILEKIQSPVKLMNDIAEYVIQGGGKRIRCLLVLLVSRACNYLGKEHIILAAMVEFFHTATLLHDDVLDVSTLRRGRKTANTLWGNKASILAGDFLFIKHLELMVELGDIRIIQLLISIAPQIGNGEIQQFSSVYRADISVEEYFDSIRAKTALLFAVASKLGALISKTDNKTQQGLYNYGLQLGTAFQLIDDAMDYCSEAEIMGKNIGDDLASGKATLPLIYALQQGNQSQQKIIKQSIEQGSLELLPQILEILDETGAIKYTFNLAALKVESAISSLNMLPNSNYKEALQELAQYVLERKN
ncbi:octaprenyl-diphosphate synthase [Legionella busanensis]|uniref:Octaprenyl-diphosphate synthase n=1 Tax=Legionella busanensis TaxID=190655 RepID=A0A378JNE2_9GAMM|nr:polyprenyl synthetase family protein [Legionella busanensis]STX52597.1 octaprenyl-diphosphate synthase [Legionella busanensis]